VIGVGYVLDMVSGWAVWLRAGRFLEYKVALQQSLIRVKDGETFTLGGGGAGGQY
jgi:hypothetical protein